MHKGGAQFNGYYKNIMASFVFVYWKPSSKLIENINLYNSISWVSAMVMHDRLYTKDAHSHHVVTHWFVKLWFERVEL